MEADGDKRVRADHRQVSGGVQQFLGQPTHLVVPAAQLDKSGRIASILGRLLNDRALLDHVVLWAADFVPE